MDTYKVTIYDSERANVVTVEVVTSEDLTEHEVEREAKRAVYAVRNDLVEGRATFAVEKIS